MGWVGLGVVVTWREHAVAACSHFSGSECRGGDTLWCSVHFLLSPFYSTQVPSTWVGAICIQDESHPSVNLQITSQTHPEVCLNLLGDSKPSRVDNKT